MKLRDISAKLRDTSERYGGIKHYLEAAGNLDRAIGAYHNAQNEDTLRVLVGAHAHASKALAQITPIKEAG